MGATVLETSWRHIEDLDLLRVRNNRRGRCRSCGALREIDEATVRHRLGLPRGKRLGFDKVVTDPLSKWTVNFLGSILSYDKIPMGVINTIQSTLRFQGHC